MKPITVVTDEDEATLWALALVDGTSVAEQRRRAIAAYAKAGRRDEHIRTLVAINVEWKRQRETTTNVVPLFRGKGYR